MTTNRTAILALAAAGALWGLTVPLSKLSLDWLGGAWLTVIRFAIAAPVLAYAGRRGLRAALTPRIAAAGAIGFGAVILLQNAGIERTSVSHAALVVGAVPVMVALMAAALGHGVARPLAWGGYGLALAGIAVVAGGGGTGASTAGDVLVFASVALSATFIVAQPRLLAGRDPAAVTAVQFAAGALVALPHALVFEGLPAAPAAGRPGGGAGRARLRGHGAARSGCSPTARRTCRPASRARSSTSSRSSASRSAGSASARRSRPTSCSAAWRCSPASRSAPTARARGGGARAAGARAPGGSVR